jgi:hypothetical protein
MIESFKVTAFRLFVKIQSTKGNMTIGIEQASS